MLVAHMAVDQRTNHAADTSHRLNAHRRPPHRAGNHVFLGVCRPRAGSICAPKYRRALFNRCIFLSTNPILYWQHIH